jgi:hypothetical protein
VSAAPALETPAWQTSLGAWRARHGAELPMIGEVSSVQRARMSATAQRRFDAERADAWSAAGECGTQWRDAVIAAYDAGEFTLSTEGLHPEARDVIRGVLVRRDEERAAREKATAYAAASRDRYTSETAKPGDVAFTYLYGWVRITRCNPKTATLARIRDNDGRFAPREPWNRVLRADPTGQTKPPSATNPHNPTETPPR